LKKQRKELRNRIVSVSACHNRSIALSRGVVLIIVF